MPMRQQVLLPMIVTGTLVLLPGCKLTVGTRAQAPGFISALCTRQSPVTEDEKSRARALINAAHTMDDLRHLAAAAKPALTRGDVDGDGRPDRVLSFGWCDLPVLVARAAEPGRLVRLPGPLPFTWQGTAGARVDRIGDINGDGRPELVVEFHAAGGSMAHKWLYLYQWRDGRFRVLFQDQLTWWVGENRWSIGPGTVTVQCHPFGPYEFKMMLHRQQTETYRWSPARGAYELAERSREPVRDQMDQVIVAEQLFQQGQYLDAAGEYRKVEGLPAFDHPDSPDWAAYARLRLGQTHALLGNRDKALKELNRAEQGKEPVAHMARLFQRYYRQKVAAEAFARVWHWIRLEAFSPDEPRSLSALWPWMLEPQVLGARRSILDAHRAVGRTPPEVLPEERDYRERSCLELKY